MSGTPTLFHSVIGGDANAAIKYGLTLKAKCGLVWTPTLTGSRHQHPDIPDCPTCFPNRPSYVYRLYDAADRLLYVGCSNNPPSRFQAHRASSWWWPHVARRRLVVFGDRTYALAREAEAIRLECPFWNKRGQIFGDLSDAEVAMRLEASRLGGAPDNVVQRFADLAANRGLDVEESA